MGSISTKTINLKYQLQRGMINLNYHIRYSRLFWVYHQKHGEKADNLTIRIYLNKTENRITFRIKTGYYLEL